jgi:hypothetical protein
MASNYVALQRGGKGFKLSDFTTGTSSTAAADIELRVEDSAGLTHKEVILALKQMITFFTNRTMNPTNPVT